jgi:hypothetical protein
MKAALSNVVQRAPFGLISAPAAMEIMADNEIVLLVFFVNFPLHPAGASQQHTFCRVFCG